MNVEISSRRTGPLTRRPLEQLQPFLKGDAELVEIDEIPAAPFDTADPGLRANIYYFGQKPWMKDWLNRVHMYPEFAERWRGVEPDWDDRVIVDIGCGPGNVLKALKVNPKITIGVDVALGSLELAREQGYTPLLADGHDIPLRCGCADIVTLNATLHHCRDMERVLHEAARLVKPNGKIIVDHDPQLSAWAFRGIGHSVWVLRKPVYRFMRRGGHRAEGDEQSWAAQSELHHRPFDGVTEDLLRSTLEADGFTVDIYPHNHAVGAEVMTGALGRAKGRIRLSQRLSGIDPDTSMAALSLMAVGVRRSQ